MDAPKDALEASVRLIPRVQRARYLDLEAGQDRGFGQDVNLEGFWTVQE